MKVPFSSAKSSPLTSAILVVFFGYLSLTVAQTLINSNGSESSRADLEQQVGWLRESKAELEKELAWVKMDQFAEQEARNKLHMVKANETVVVYPEQDSVVLGEAVEMGQNKAEVASKRQSWGEVEEWKRLFGF